jgi:hypothetical protein
MISRKGVSMFCNACMTILRILGSCIFSISSRSPIRLRHLPPLTGEGWESPLGPPEGDGACCGLWCTGYIIIIVFTRSDPF